MRRYWIQNDPHHFESILTKFIICLTKRGHNLQDLLPLLQHAASQLNNQHARQRNNDKPNTLYIHQRYHPNGLQRADIRTLYETTLKHYLDYDAMTVAISHPRNLQSLIEATRMNNN
jgi:hypothetical protein